MAITIKTRYIIIFIIALVLTLFFSGYIIGHKKANNASEGSLNTMSNIISMYQTEIADIKVFVARKEQEIKTLKEAKQNGDVKNEELRKLNLKHVNEITRLRTQIDTLLANVNHNGVIVHVDTVIVEGKKENALLLPFSFIKEDQWLSLKGIFNTEGKLDISLKKDIYLDVWTGIEKKTKRPVSIITTTDPYINTVNINSQKYDLAKTKYYGIGLQIGYGIDLKKMSPAPYLGVGLAYNVIRW